MNIYLVYPDIDSIHGTSYHPGLASIASVLSSRGHTVRMAYFDSLKREAKILQEISDFRPGLVGFTAVETQFAYARYLAGKIKRIFNTCIIAGGPYATLAPENILSDRDVFDMAIQGEGELAVSELANRIQNNQDFSSVNNLVYRDAGTKMIRINPLNPIIENLDALPYPDTRLFNYQGIIDKKNIAPFHFNRGCPYQCAYCSNKAFAQIYGRGFNNIRYRSVSSVIGEIGNTLSVYKLRRDTMLQFLDDLFIFDKSWLRGFCAAYKKEINRPYWCTGRSNHINDEVCSLLKDSGCRMLMMSVESGNDYIRNEVMKRNISRQILFNSFELCNKYGLKTLATCVIGLPFETRAHIEDSLKTVSQLKSIRLYGINIFYPYKGTSLRRVCEERGYMPEDVDYFNFVERKGSILKLPDISNTVLRFYCKNWEKLIMKQKGIFVFLEYSIKQSLKVLLRYFLSHRHFLERYLHRQYLIL